MGVLATCPEDMGLATLSLIRRVPQLTSRKRPQAGESATAERGQAGEEEEGI